MQFGKIVLLLLVYLGCISNLYAIDKEDISLIHYYKGFYSNYRHPFKGQGEISPKDIKKFDSYYVEERDNNGNIVSFKSILDKKCFFEFEYEYDPSGNLVKFTKKQCNNE